MDQHSRAFFIQKIIHPVDVSFGPDSPACLQSDSGADKAAVCDLP